MDKWSITKKLILAFLVVGLAPLISAELLSTNIMKEELQNGVENYLVQSVQLREAAVMAYLSGIEGRALDFSSDTFVRDKTKELENGSAEAGVELNQHLTGRKALDEDMEGILVLDRNGRVVASSDAKEVGRDESREEYFIKGRTGAFSHHFRHEHFGVQSFFVASAPITDRLTGETIGVIALVFNGDSIYDALSEIPYTETTRSFVTYIVDKNSTVVAHSNRTLAGAMTTVDTLPVNECHESGKDAVAIYKNHAGKEVLGASICNAKHGWTFIAEIETRDAFLPINRAYFFLGFVTIFFISFVVLIGLVLSNTVTKPVKSLTRVIERLSTGESDIEIEPWLKEAGDETGDLARAFDRTLVSLKMAIGEAAPEMRKQRDILTKALEETEKEHRIATESEARFAAFMNSTPLVAWIKDGNFRYVYINRPYEGYFRITSDEIKGKDDFDVFPKSVADELRRNDMQVLASGQPLETIENVPLPGERPRRWWVFKFPMKAGERQYVSGFALDLDVVERAGKATGHVEPQPRETGGQKAAKPRGGRGGKRKK